MESKKSEGTGNGRGCGIALSVIFLALVSSSLFSQSQELTTDITDITDNGISYSNSKGNLFVGLDYSESLDGNS